MEDQRNDNNKLDTSDLFQTYNTSEQGLTNFEVLQRLEIYGKNTINVEEKENLFIKFLGQFKEPLIILLLSSAVISVLMGEIADAIGIFIAVTIVNSVGFYQEYKSEKSIEALSSLTTYHCSVIRDGKILTILTEDLVPGDIVPMESGSRVPADIRLFEAKNLQINPF